MPGGIFSGLALVAACVAAVLLTRRRVERAIDSAFGDLPALPEGLVTDRETRFGRVGSQEATGHQGRHSGGDL